MKKFILPKITRGINIEKMTGNLSVLPKTYEKLFK